MKLSPRHPPSKDPSCTHSLPAFASRQLGRRPQVAYISASLQGKLSSKAPFSQYGALAERGASVVWGSPADPSSLPSQDFDVVYDNNGKDMEACQPLIDAFKVRPGGPSAAQTRRASLLSSSPARLGQAHGVAVHQAVASRQRPEASCLQLRSCYLMSRHSLCDGLAGRPAGQGGALCVCGLGWCVQGQGHRAHAP